MREEKIKKIVREGCAKIVKSESCCYTPSVSKKIGYTEEDLSSLPQDAQLSLGCRNPVALASLKKGETVLLSWLRRRI